MCQERCRFDLLRNPHYAVRSHNKETVLAYTPTLFSSRWGCSQHFCLEAWTCRSFLVFRLKLWEKPLGASACQLSLSREASFPTPRPKLVSRSAGSILVGETPSSAYRVLGRRCNPQGNHKQAFLVAQCSTTGSGSPVCPASRDSLRSSRTLSRET